ncbi:MAG: protein translocase subunit SecF [Clostridia bacterium]|nr:protein translocase subunit SecF [Clostridia bacterium]
MSKKKFNLMNIGSNLKVAGKWNIYLLVPAVIVLAAIIAFSIFAAVNHTAQQGMNLGLDFTGGTALTVKVGRDLTDQEFQDVSKAFVKIIEDKGFSASEPQKTGVNEETAVYIKYFNAAEDDDKLGDLNNEIVNEVAVKATEMGYDVNNSSEDISWQAISAGSAKRLVRQAIIAIVITWALVLLYVIIRFELWSGIAALIALMFDVIVMTSLTILFHVPVNSTFVAALITIVAYSINNTIIVFDRVRDHVKNKGTTITAENIGFEVDSAVQETTGRSIATTITTMLTVIVLCIIGVDAVREFCLPVIFGLLSGVFTSLFIAPSLYVAMRMSWFRRKAKNAGYENVAAVKTNASAPAKPAKKKKKVAANVTHKYKRK